LHVVQRRDNEAQGELNVPLPGELQSIYSRMSS
jgi:hypothetical protein